jgi:hypothetical protein
MSLRGQLERKIQAKNQEIAKLESELLEARSYVQGLQDALKMLPRDNEAANLGKILRHGSDMAKTRERLLKEGKPMHIDDILKALGKGKEHKASISGSLGNYVRKGEIFTRPAPNTFGLKEFESDLDASTNGEPPDDFGLVYNDSGVLEP